MVAKILQLKPNRLPETNEEMSRRYREPDDELEQIQKAIADYVKGHDDIYWAYADIAAAVPCAFQTVKRLAENTTRYPANTTCTRILRVCGWERRLVRIETKKWKTA